MYPGFGPQKIEMNKRTRSEMPSPEYDAMKKSMLKRNDPMAQLAFEGAGDVMKSEVDPQYGNVNRVGLTTGMMQGTEGLTATPDSPYNMPMAKPTAQTAQLGFFSETQSPQKSPELMGQEAELGIRQRVLGEPGGLNNREELYRRGA